MPLSVTARDVRPMTRLLRVLGDETRLRIVALLTHGELCVCHIAKALDLAQPSASRHLATLRAADVVETRRDGSWIYYRLAPLPDEECRAILRALTRSFADNETLGREVKRLVRAAGPGSCR